MNHSRGVGKVQHPTVPEDVGCVRTVILGVNIELQAGQQLAMLDFLCRIPTTDKVVYLSGNEDGLSLWFSRPRQAGSFITHWSFAVYPIARTPLRPLLPPQQYIAIRPRADDMLSV